MRTQSEYPIHNPLVFKENLLHWCMQFNVFAYLDSNQFNTGDKLWYHDYDLLAAVDAQEFISLPAGNALTGLEKLADKGQQWLFGVLGYDLKNEMERLTSVNSDNLGFNDLQFFVPGVVFILRGNLLTVDCMISCSGLANPEYLIGKLDSQQAKRRQEPAKGALKNRITYKEYADAVMHLQKHIHRGDIFEVNYCQEFYMENYTLSPADTFLALMGHHPSPFASFFRFNHNYILSASPERFIKRKGNHLVSQPMKGTSGRAADGDGDRQMAFSLLENVKERSENIMITDLVRNDLSKVALKNSVKVEELCSLYSYNTVHQMVSTISATVSPGTGLAEIIRNTFPMGSMTGAPKVSAMQLIEQYEASRRGVYSGAAGYLAPDGSFDFSVLIRTILYNQERHYLSYHAGSAITAASDIETEYNECLLKTLALRKALNLP